VRPILPFAHAASQVQFLAATVVRITLNGEPFELDQPLSVEELLGRLEIDSRRVAVEHNLAILKRHAFATTLVGDGDRVEIVNFVGGG
jgi:thiamine biosynthesis protein ThiS